MKIGHKSRLLVSQGFFSSLLLFGKLFLNWNLVLIIPFSFVNNRASCLVYELLDRLAGQRHCIALLVLHLMINIIDLYVFVLAATSFHYFL